MLSIVSGEKLQSICDVYCGRGNDLYYNPLIASQTSKHMYIDRLEEQWDNPRHVFCYSDALEIFMSKLHLIKNSFVLVSHNGDVNITEKYLPLLENDKVIRWYAQNIMFDHAKLHFLPIGIANSMWNHGNLSNLTTVFEQKVPKNKDCYFWFTVRNNFTERSLCKEKVESKGLVFGDYKHHYEYLLDLSSHKFAISPPGNGIDCHRYWECYYLEVIPIALKSTLTLKIKEKLPIVLLDNWDDLDLSKILHEYDNYVKELREKITYLDLNYYRNVILN